MSYEWDDDDDDDIERGRTSATGEVSMTGRSGEEENEVGRLKVKCEWVQTMK